MITKKDWNSLPKRTRETAVAIVFNHMFDNLDFMQEMSEEWHHDNDKWHAILFSSLYWDNKEKTRIKAIHIISVR